MQNKKPGDFYLLNSHLTTDEKIKLINDVLQKITITFTLKQIKANDIFRYIKTPVLFLRQLQLSFHPSRLFMLIHSRIGYYRL